MCILQYDYQWCYHGNILGSRSPFSSSFPLEPFLVCFNDPFWYFLVLPHPASRLLDTVKFFFQGETFLNIENRSEGTRNIELPWKHNFGYIWRCVTLRPMSFPSFNGFCHKLIEIALFICPMSNWVEQMMPSLPLLEYFTNFYDFFALCK